MSNRILITLFVTVGLVVTVVWLALKQHRGAQKIVQREKQLEEDVEKLTEPMTSSIRNYNPVTVTRPRAHSRERESMILDAPSEQRESPNSLAAPLSIFAADPQPTTASPREPKMDYAPAFRLVRCQLVNTVDSSNIPTPIIGLVTDDLWWNGKNIIRANSEVHGVASVDRVRERIESNGEFTFVLNEPDGSGRELVVRLRACRLTANS
jgi:hypothetical protein